MALEKLSRNEQRIDRVIGPPWKESTFIPGFHGKDKGSDFLSDPLFLFNLLRVG